MDQNHDLNASNGGIKALEMPKSGNNKKSKNCNQCEYTTSHAGNLRKHLKTHTGEKSNNCNQRKKATSEARM